MSDEWEVFKKTGALIDLDEKLLRTYQIRANDFAQYIKDNPDKLWGIEVNFDMMIHRIRQVTEEITNESMKRYHAWLEQQRAFDTQQSPDEPA